jgi:hypothetical protein
MPNDPGDYTVSKYDRLRGNLHGIALFTKPSTVKNIEQITGRAETFVIETCRRDDLGGDFIFVECVDETGVTRLALPPKVANAVASQRDALTKRSRSRAAKRRAAAMTPEQKQAARDRLAKARRHA